MANKTKTFAVDVELSDQQAKTISAKSKVGLLGMADAVNHIAQEVGDGGIVLNSKVYDQVRGLMGEITDQQEIVKLVEAGLHRRDGSIEATWRPDPQYIPVLEELAKTRGATTMEMAQDIMDYVVGQGWMYQLMPDTKQCFFSREQSKMIQEWLGKEGHFTGQDLFDALFSKAKAA